MARTPEQQAAYNAARREQRKANPAQIRDRERAYYARNRDKMREQLRARYAANKDKIRKREKKQRALNPDKTRLNNLQRVHGLSPQGWAAYWQEQDGQCYLCGAELPTKGGGVHIDHDHRHCPPGKSCPVCRRGLTCNGCNLAVGHAKDDPGRLRRMASALEKANAAVVQRMNERDRQLSLYEGVA